MAGDWIKMRTGLFSHPKVVRMASALREDTLRTVGGLMSAWCLFDAHSEDGRLDGYTPELLDEHVRWPGFSAAMESVEWLRIDPQGIELPEFDAHNGQSAKRRAQEANRKRNARKASASDADKKRTREEKRREEIGTTTNTASVEIPEGANDLARALQSMGWEQCSPRSPDIVQMAQMGVTVDELRDAANGKAGKPLSYLATRVIGRRADRAQQGQQTAQPAGPARDPAAQAKAARRLELNDRLSDIRHRHETLQLIDQPTRERLEAEAWEQYREAEAEAVS